MSNINNQHICELKKTAYMNKAKTSAKWSLNWSGVGVLNVLQLFLVNFKFMN